MRIFLKMVDDLIMFLLLFLRLEENSFVYLSFFDYVLVLCIF